MEEMSWKPTSRTWSRAGGHVLRIRLVVSQDGQLFSEDLPSCQTVAEVLTTRNCCTQVFRKLSQRDEGKEYRVAAAVQVWSAKGSGRCLLELLRGLKDL